MSETGTATFKFEAGIETMVTGIWRCPAGVNTVTVECWGAGGSGWLVPESPVYPIRNAGGGGGYACVPDMPVTQGKVYYPLTYYYNSLGKVAGDTGAFQSANFVGDNNTGCCASAGNPGSSGNFERGFPGKGCTGTTLVEGGYGGLRDDGCYGGGGGGSAGLDGDDGLAYGATGAGGATGGIGAYGGGNGGNGDGSYFFNTAGSFPGGGGGGGGAFEAIRSGGGSKILISWVAPDNIPISCVIS